MKPGPRGLDAWCRRPDPQIRAVLVYGPDEGLVRERIEALGHSVLDDLRDPFRATELTAETVAGDPARLADEAQSLALTGGRRLVIVRGAGDRLTAACEDLISTRFEALVLVAGGDLPARSSLRKLFEGAADLAAVPCYVEEGAAVAGALRTMLAEQGVQADDDALAWAAEALEGDRGLQRRAAEVLANYAGPGGRLDREAAMAVLGEAGSAAIEDAVEAAAGGDLARLGPALDRLFGEGTAPVALLRQVQTHLRRLHLVQSKVEAGMPLEAAIRTLAPPVFFKAQGEFRRQAAAWRPGPLANALASLIETEAATKRTGAPATLLTARAFTELALTSPARRRP